MAQLEHMEISLWQEVMEMTQTSEKVTKHFSLPEVNVCLLETR